MTEAGEHVFVFPASAEQRGLWLADQIVPNSPLYTMANGIRLDGNLDVPALEHSLQSLVQRHEALRTSFTADARGLRQVIASAASVPLRQIDLTTEPEPMRPARMNELIAAAVRESFDVTRGPLVRFTLYRLGPRQHVLLVALHHIVADGWSVAILFRELATIYDARSGHHAPLLAEPPLQYADFAVWQDEHLRSGALADDTAYWRQQLHLAPPTLDVPTDHPRTSRGTFAGERYDFFISDAQAAAVDALSRREQVTPFMVLLAAFQTLLYRYTGRRDVIVGSPVANRNRPELEGVVGLFVNTVVLRTDLSRNPRFRELLGRVRDVTLAAYDHANLPYETVVEVTQPERCAGRTPLVQVLFAFQSNVQSCFQLPELTMTPFEIHSGTAKFDVTLELVETGQGVRGCVEFSTEFFAADRIARLVEHFKTLLAGATADPGLRLSDLPLLTESERHRILREWTATSTEYPRNRCLHNAFEDQVERTPDATAVVFKHQRASYRELNARANQLARYVRAFGVGPDSVVGFCMGRSLDAVVALLAILKAGAAFVALDPAYPPLRRGYIARDARIELLIVDGHAASIQLPEHARVIDVDEDRERIGRQRTDDPESDVSPQNLCYVVYTSGSTGKPKGVAIQHSSAVAFVHWARVQFAEDLGAVLASSPFCFDLSLFELFAPLTSGGKVIVAESALDIPKRSRNPADAPTLVNTVPSVMAEVLHIGKLPAAVRTVNLAGETLRASLARQIDRRGGVRRVYNLYGPSESTVYATAGSVSPEATNDPTIGRPIANTQVYVLGPHLEPVPVGVPGEICLAGAGLARGYLHQPGLTAARFIPHPFSDTPGARLYRTGDVGRYRDDGSIEFVGRLDRQVKVRGMRVELEEIEAVLRSHAGIDDAVAVVTKDERGEERLIGYYAATGSPSPPAVDDVRAFLGEALPNHMIPAVLVPVLALPRTPSGKVDANALPIPDVREHGSRRSDVSRTPTEDMLASIWSHVLGRDSINVEDDFFALGGHSLLAMRLISRACEAFRIQLPIRTIFESPTLHGLAQRIDAARRKGTRSGRPPVSRLGPVHEAPLSAGQRHLWVLDRILPNLPLSTISTVLELRGDLDVRALEWCLNHIVERHDVLRTTFHALGERLVQTTHRARTLALRTIDLAQRPGETREADLRRTIATEARRPFDLSEDVLLRATLLHSGERTYTLLLSMHHIIADAWSLDVVIGELAALYGTSFEDRRTSLPALSIQYADFAHWQRQQLEGGFRTEAVAYWKQRLEPPLPVLRLPFDRRPPPVRTYRVARLPWNVDEDLCEALHALSRRETVTMFMLLLAAFQALLTGYTGQDDVCVATMMANRERTETEPLIGLFANTVILRSDLSGNPSFRKLLKRVRETVLGAYDYQNFPFEELVETLEQEGRTDVQSLADVMFLYDDTPARRLELPGGVVMTEPAWADSATDLDISITTFHVIFSVRDTGNGLGARLAYDPDVFDAPTIGRMLDRFTSFLQRVVADPGMRLRDFRLDDHPSIAARPSRIDDVRDGSAPGGQNAGKGVNL